MKKLLVLVLVLGLALPVLAMDIVTTDDTTCRSSDGGGSWTNYNASDPFGLFVRYLAADLSYIEFTLGGLAADSATLKLENTSAASGPWGTRIDAVEFDFDEATYTGPGGNDYAGWDDVAIFSPEAVGVYEIDVTDWYNANLGKTMTMCLNVFSYPASPSAGPLFEDHEGTAGTSQLGAPVMAPTISVVEVPEPMTMILLGLGGMALIRRKRA